MAFTIHNLVQGSPEWIAHRANCHNASDLSAAMGTSRYKSRTDLIRQMATGIEPEIDAATQRRFDDGHRFEALARPIAEKIIGRDLYPITASIEIDGLARRLSASLDGATDDDSTNFEHKSLNSDLAAALDNGIIPEEYWPQMEQGMLINGASRTLFMASKWDENDNLIEEKHLWYESRPELRSKIVPTWRQIEEDAASYQHVEVKPAVVAEPQMALPAVAIQVEGSIALRDNLAAFGVSLKDYISGLNKKPKTDQEFADLDASAKLLREVQTKIAAARDGALGQIASIDTMKRTADVLEELARTTAIEIEKLVKAEKDNRRAAIIQKGKDDFSARVTKLNERLGKPYMPEIAADFSVAVKGLKSIASIQNAVDAELARATIEAHQIADLIQLNLNYLRDEAGEFKMLFPDTAQIVLKAPDDLQALVKMRIAEHKEAEAKRLEAERERIAAEERENIEREQAEKSPAPVASEPARWPWPAAQAAQAEASIPMEKCDGDHAEVVPCADPNCWHKPAPIAHAIAPSADTGERIKLGEINSRLAPLSLTAAGLAQLGFQAAGKEGAAVLFKASDFPAICTAIVRHVHGIANNTMKEAA